MATVEMGIPEERFWRMTMRKLNLLWKQHMKFKYPQPKEESEVNVKGKKEIGKYERASIEDLDFL